MRVAGVITGWSDAGLGVTQEQAAAAELLRSALVRLRAAASRCPSTDQNDWVHEIDPEWGYPAGAKCEMWTPEEISAFMTARKVLASAVAGAGGTVGDAISPMVPDRIADILPRLERLLTEYRALVEQPAQPAPPPTYVEHDLEPVKKPVWPWVLGGLAAVGLTATAVWAASRRS